MAFELNRIIRPNIQKMVPYATARDEFKDTGDGKERIMLDANENPYDTGYNRYPDPLAKEVKEKLARIKGVQPSQIFLGNGSDECIDALMRSVCQPGKDAILIQPPTYGMYEVWASIQDVAVIRVPLDADFMPDADRILKAITPETKIVFFCSPNNPTGNLQPKEVMERVLREWQDGIVVVDEAYSDFAPEGSLLPDLADYPNLVILQTFSKAWGMAGIRLGMAFASPELVAVLNKVKAPYNINQMTQQAALNGLAYQEVTEGLMKILLSERRRLTAELEKLPKVEKVYPSDANFLLVRVTGGHDAYQYLLQQDIVVRDRSKVQECLGCLRISIGTPQENDQLLEALANF